MERVRTTDPNEAEKLAKKGIPVDLVDDIEEKKSKKRPDYADVDGDGDREEPMAKAFKDKEKLNEDEPLTQKVFADLPVGQTIQYRGASSKIKSNDGYNIELEDGTKVNYNMFTRYGRVVNEEEEVKLPADTTFTLDLKHLMKKHMDEGKTQEDVIKLTKALMNKLHDKGEVKVDGTKIIFKEIKKKKSGYMGYTELAENNTQLTSPKPDTPNFLGPDNKDYEGEMAKSQMLKMKKYVMALCNMIEDESQLEAWVQAKLTKASEYMSAVYHYLDYQASQSNEMMVGSKPETDMIFMADKKRLK